MAPNGFHFDGTSSSSGQTTGNPSASPFNVVVSVPDTITIRMVDASTLNDYEIWLFIASLTSSASIGFLVAYIQAKDSTSSSATPIGYMTLILVALFAIAIITALGKRQSLNAKGKTINLRTSDQATPVA